MPKSSLRHTNPSEPLLETLQKARVSKHTEAATDARLQKAFEFRKGVGDSASAAAEDESDDFFTMFDVLSEHKAKKPRAPVQAGAITCNSVVMEREMVEEEAEDGFVYDLYYTGEEVDWTEGRYARSFLAALHFTIIICVDEFKGRRVYFFVCFFGLIVQCGPATVFWRGWRGDCGGRSRR